MFENPIFFDIGLMWLRADHGEDIENEFMPDLTEINHNALQAAGLSFRDLVEGFDRLEYFPSLYGVYCDEIESRHQIGMVV